MKLLRRTLTLALLGSALVGRANLINFDNLASGANVGNAYLLTDGVSFVNGTVLAYGTPPSTPNALIPADATLTVDSPVNSLVTSVGFLYASNSLGSGITTTVPSLSVYSGLDGTGSLLGSIALPDTPSGLAAYAPITLSFSGSAHSFVFRDQAYTHILFDNLSFTSQPTPEPSALAALGLGAVALIRRRKR